MCGPTIPPMPMQVAKVAHVPNVAKRAEDVIGEVDAVLIATDKGFEHVERARPFIEAGIPVFIDKPLCDNRARPRDVLDRWVAEGKPLISSSAMRFAKEYAPYHRATHALGPAAPCQRDDGEVVGGLRHPRAGDGLSDHRAGLRVGAEYRRRRPATSSTCAIATAST